MSITSTISTTEQTGASPVGTSRWQIDSAHSSAHFSVRHMMISNVRGEFSKVTGTVNFDEQDIAQSSVRASIDVASINTREPDRDAHLKSPDFFDVSKYPAISFQSKNISRSAEGRLTVAGDLTMHGVTREVVLSVDELTPVVKDPWGNTRFGISARGRLNRKDFGLNWNAAIEGGGILVGEQIDLTLDVEFVKNPA